MRRTVALEARRAHFNAAIQPPRTAFARRAIQSNMGWHRACLCPDQRRDHGFERCPHAR